MKKIKFKGWHKISRKMVESITVLGDTDYKYLQFSGLKDMDGNEIYEGDLLFEDYTDEDGRIDWVIVEIIFNDFSDVGYVDRKRGSNNIYDTRLNRSDTRLKLLGNKYEHPNLLRRFVYPKLVAPGGDSNGNK